MCLIHVILIVVMVEGHIFNRRSIAIALGGGEEPCISSEKTRKRNKKAKAGNRPFENVWVLFVTAHLKT